MEKMALRCRGRACVEHALIKTRLLKEVWPRVAERAVRRVLGTFHTPPRVRINIHHSPYEPPHAPVLLLLGSSAQIISDSK